jgi:hypothetical protein
MTKGGQPSRISDIRYFQGDKNKYLKGREEAVAFGRRLAWLLNGEGFSLGSYHSAYILLTSSVAPGDVQITDDGGDWWQRYTLAGVPPDFPDREDASELVRSATIAALKAIRPDLAAVVEDAQQTVRTHGDSLRFLLKTHTTKHFVVEVSCNIAVWPQHSLLFVSITDRSSGGFLEAQPTPLQFYALALDIVGRIKITAASVEILPSQSVSARLTSGLHGGPIVKPISEFLPAVRPPLSKLIRRRAK